MKNNNENRRVGNHIIIATKDSKKSYYNWPADCLNDDRANATGYHKKWAAMSVIAQLKVQFPGYTWKTVLDK